MHVILARHGNTFDPGDPSVWAGARTDLPLVAKGREQAAKIGEALKKCNLLPRRIWRVPSSVLKKLRAWPSRLRVSAASISRSKSVCVKSITERGKARARRDPDMRAQPKSCGLG